MRLKLGTTDFDAEDLDLPDMVTNARFGGTKFRPHEAAIAKELDGLRERLVMKYDCTSGKGSLFNVDPYDQAVHIEFRPYFVGFSNNGNHTPKGQEGSHRCLGCEGRFHHCH